MRYFYVRSTEATESTFKIVVLTKKELNILIYKLLLPPDEQRKS